MQGLKQCSTGVPPARGASRCGGLSSEAAAAVEYGPLVALIPAVVIGIVSTLGGQLITGFQSVIDGL